MSAGGCGRARRPRGARWPACAPAATSAGVSPSMPGVTRLGRRCAGGSGRCAATSSRSRSREPGDVGVLDQVVRVPVVPLVADRVADVVQQRRRLEARARRRRQLVQRGELVEQRQREPRHLARVAPRRSGSGGRAPARPRRSAWSSRVEAGGGCRSRACPRAARGSTAVTDSSPRCCTSASRITAPATTMSARRGSKRLRRWSGAIVGERPPPPARSAGRWRAPSPSAAAKPTTALMVPELPSAAPRRARRSRRAAPRASASRGVAAHQLELLRAAPRRWRRTARSAAPRRARGSTGRVGLLADAHAISVEPPPMSSSSERGGGGLPVQHAQADQPRLLRARR